MNSTTSHGYKVEAKPGFDLARSNPMQKQYFFFYTITITNISGTQAQLKSRTWHIVDGNKEVRTVQGPGVVGETPWFPAGESFEYSSFCPLPTLTGTMQGQFHMRSIDGSEFSSDVPTMRFEVPEDYIDRY